jgi:hypothetical protein
MSQRRGDPPGKHPKQVLLERYSAVEGHNLRSRLPKGMAFALMLFDFGEGGFLSYTGNSNREDFIKVLRETLAMLEAQGGPTMVKGSPRDRA